MGKPLKGVIKGAKVLGWVGEIINLFLGIYNVKKDPGWGNRGRLQAAYTIAAVNFIPVVGVPLSFILTVIEQEGGMNWYYELLDKYEAWYKENDLCVENFHVPRDIWNPSGSPVFSIEIFDEDKN